MFASAPVGVSVSRSPATCCIHRSLLERLDLKALPDDYGIDISITLTALDAVSASSRFPWSRRSIRRRKATASG